MERAGAGLAELVDARAPDGPVAVVCGKGNNGGDGLVVARLLRERGREVDVLLLGDPGELRGDARANLERLPGRRRRGRSTPARSTERRRSSTRSWAPASPASRASRPGARSRPSTPPREHAAVVACDVPSGVDASTGEVAGAAVRADATATFHAGKPGLWIAPGKDHAGSVTVVDIGIPPGRPGRPAVGLIGAGVLDEVPRRGRESTKFAAGACWCAAARSG